MVRPIALAALFCTTSAVIPMQTTSRQIVSVGPAPVGPYSPAVSAGGLVHVSGTLARDATGAVVGRGDVAAQTRTVLDRIAAVLAAAGTSLDNVVSVTVYLKSAADFQTMNDVFRTYWQMDPPTRTTVIADFVLADALVEMSAIAVPAGGERTVIHPADWLRSPSPYSYGIKTGDTLFMSGLVSRNGRDNSVVTGDVATQTKAVMENARQILEAAGMGFANVVSARVFIPRAADFQRMNETYRAHFPSAPPARATVVADLAGRDYVVEIAFIAASSPKEAIAGDGPANPNLSAGIRVGRRLYVSGTLGNTPQTQGDATAQTRETLARMGKVLSAAGYSPSDVVDAIVYLPDVSQFTAMNGAYRSFFQRDVPARTTVKTGLVASDALVEIMAVAVKA